MTLNIDEFEKVLNQLMDIEIKSIHDTIEGAKKEIKEKGLDKDMIAQQLMMARSYLKGVERGAKIVRTALIHLY